MCILFSKYVAGVSKVNPFELHAQHYDPELIVEDKRREVAAWRDSHPYYSLGYKDTIERIELNGIDLSEAIMYMQDIPVFHSSRRSTKLGTLNYNVLNVHRLQTVNPNNAIYDCLGRNAIDNYYTRGPNLRNVSLYEFTKCYEYVQDNRLEGYIEYKKLRDIRLMKTIVIRTEHLNSKSVHSKILFLKLFWPHFKQDWDALQNDEQKLEKIVELRDVKPNYYEYCHKVMFCPNDDFKILISRCIDDNDVLQDKTQRMAEELHYTLIRNATGYEVDICDIIRNQAYNLANKSFNQIEFTEKVIALQNVIHQTSQRLIENLELLDEYRDSPMSGKIEYISRVAWSVKDMIYIGNREAIINIDTNTLHNAVIDMDAFKKIYELLHNKCITDDQRGFFSYTVQSILSRYGYSVADSKWTIINGKAGCGKSHVLSYIWILFNIFNIRIAILSVSAKASIVMIKYITDNYTLLYDEYDIFRRVNNVVDTSCISTIHSFFSMQVGRISLQINEWREIVCDKHKILIFDEFSMLNYGLLDNILSIFANYLNVPKNNVEIYKHFLVILLGDMFQMGPVSGRAIYLSKEMMMKFLVRRQMVQVARRNDPQFIDLLEVCRNPFDYSRRNNMSKLGVVNFIIQHLKNIKNRTYRQQPIKLFFLNKQINKYNRKYIDNKCIAPMFLLEMRSIANYEELRVMRRQEKYDVVELHDFDLRVAVKEIYMFTVNLDASKFIMNGVRFIINSVTLNNMMRITSFKYSPDVYDNREFEYFPQLIKKTVEINNTIRRFAFNGWYFKLYKGVSITKSQGLTISDGLHVNLDWKTLRREKLQTIYMVLSRVPSIDRITIDKLNEPHLKTILAFQFNNCQQLTNIIDGFERFANYHIELNNLLPYNNANIIIDEDDLLHIDMQIVARRPFDINKMRFAKRD